MVQEPFAALTSGDSQVCRNDQVPQHLIRLRCIMIQKPYPAEKARGGEIILNTPARRAIFIAGLIGAVVLALALTIIH
jgi:hypothetical protein